MSVWDCKLMFINSDAHFTQLETTFDDTILMQSLKITMKDTS